MTRIKPGLSRRERQIMDIVYRLGTASAATIQEEMPSAPGYSAVRAMLRVLEEKGHLTHRLHGQRYVFYPVVRRDQAGRSALRHLMDTFFEGSTEGLVATLLEDSREELSEQQLARLTELIKRAREEGR